jgi:hypothetical protein
MVEVRRRDKTGRESMAVRKFLLKLGEVSLKAKGRKVVRLGTKLRTAD